MIDYVELLATLEQQVNEQEAEVAKTHELIAAVRKQVGATGKIPRANGRRPKAAKGARSKPAAAKPSKGSGRGNPIPPDVLAVMKAMYEKGAPLPEITRSTGRTTSSIYGYSSKLGWKRPPRAKIVAAAVTLTGTQLGGRVSCPSCHLKTDQDPCEHCGKAVRK